MSVSHVSLEGEYVHNVYSRLATYQPPDKPHLPSPRVWPKVTKFVEAQKDGCLILDVGKFGDFFFVILGNFNIFLGKAWLKTLDGER